MEPTVKEQIAALVTEARDLQGAVKSASGEWTDEQRARADQLSEQLADLGSKQQRIERDAGRMKSLTEIVPVDEIGPPPDSLVPALASAPQLPRKGESLADLFLKSEEWRELKERFPNINESTRGLTSRAVNVGGMKALLSVTGAGGAQGFVIPDYLGLQPTPPIWGPPLTVRDVVTNGSTTSDTVDFVQVATATGAATPVPEPQTVAAAVAKPEAALTFATVVKHVQTIATTLPVTKRAMADVGQLTTLINSFLGYAVQSSLENQIVNGDGTGSNFLGLFASGLPTQAWDTDIFTSIRRAMTKVTWPGGSTPTALLINPTDNETLDLAKDLQGRFYGNGPFVPPGPQSVWGVPRVVSFAVPVGKGIIGDFRQAVLWDRQQSSIAVSDSHQDFFVKNLVMFLCELRAAFGIFRPQALVEVALNASVVLPFSEWDKVNEESAAAPDETPAPSAGNGGAKSSSK